MNESRAHTTAPILPAPSRFAPLIGVMLGFAGACTAILAPKDDVERCRATTDCSTIDDNRYVRACRFDEEHSDLDSSKIDKICVAEYDSSISCAEEDFTLTNEDHPFGVALKKCGKGDYSCDDAHLGMLGCPPPDGAGCANGLELKTFGTSSYCGDSGSDDPVIPGVGLGGQMLAGQDVRDQFCKSYFCDDTFVCGPDKKCVQCDPSREYGQGGCGIVYANGAPAPAYVLGESLTSQCLGPDASTETPVFGESCS